MAVDLAGGLAVSAAAIEGFGAVSRADAQWLVLGSMPGVASLDAHEYYAHPRNAFWPIMEALFGIAASDPYGQRLEAMIARRVALWDVLRSCRRPGSLDASIEAGSVVANDFPAFFERHQAVSAVLLNGRRAEQEFRRRVLPNIDRDLDVHPLPSTSPAHAAMSFEAKRDAWRAAFLAVGAGLRGT